MGEEITLLGGAVKLELPEGGFRPGLDTVLLAASCPAKAGQSVLDAGCGTGAAGYCLMRRIENLQLTGVEVQPRMAEIARHNAGLNGFAERVNVIEGDIARYAYGLNKPQFDHVICNPPYWEEGAHSISPDDSRAKAMGFVEEDHDLEHWVKACLVALKSNGTLTLIFRADGLDMVMGVLAKRFGDIEIFPLWPKDGQKAKRVIVRAKRDRKGPTQILAGMVVHREDGSWTERAEAILRNPLPLF